MEAKLMLTMILSMLITMEDTLTNINNTRIIISSIISTEMEKQLLKDKQKEQPRPNPPQMGKVNKITNKRIKDTMTTTTNSTTKWIPMQPKPTTNRIITKVKKKVKKRKSKLSNLANER